MNQTICAEFTKSMNKAIEQKAKELNAADEEIQIGIELDAEQKNSYKVFKKFAYIRPARLNEVLFLSPIYSVFRGKIEDKINQCLVGLSKKHESNFILVFIGKSKTRSGEIRMLLYVNSKFNKDLTIEEIISLKD